ncbi:MAG: Cna B-type domain-containing protein, partial [Clostridiales bacterium]|nr:Cna B-type domain-containing protein [Clostridiales bacterium]
MQDSDRGNPMSNADEARTNRSGNRSYLQNRTHEGGASIAGRNSKLNKGSRLAAATIMMLLAVFLVLGNITSVYADDLVNTVPNSEAPEGKSFYSDEISTGFKPNGYTPPTIIYGQGYGPYTVGGVYQSLSKDSPTSFAAGLPLGTIFIDQNEIGTTKGKVKYVSDNPAILAGLVENIGGEKGRVGYDGTKSGAIKLVPNKINKLEGDLFTVTFENAAIKPNGERANLVITYSNARIVIDQRYASAPEGDRYLHGAVYLAQGNQFSYGTTDYKNFSTEEYASAAETAVNTVANKYNSDFKNDKAKYPAVGTTMDATYQIYNKDGTLASGSFVFAICGINLDRDPDVGDGNNVNKPLWYSYDEHFGGTGEAGGENGKVHSFFSEAMSINSGRVSDNVYVRPNNDKEDNPEKIAGVKGQFYWANVSKGNDGVIKFISNAVNNVDPQLGGHDASYNAGFVTLADAANGFRVTATGHGSSANKMNSPVFNSKQIWYRYISGSGPHGKIETTSEGNWGGKLNDGGSVLDGGSSEKPNTYVIAEGKTVTYTMTPDTGYKIRKLTVNKDPVKDVNKMKKGDTITVTTAAGHDGILKYEEDGTYTFKFVYAKKDEEIFVEWEPTTADLLTYKIWDDANDADGMRKGADGTDKWPKVKLQRSLDGGASWTDVTKNAYDNILTNSVQPEDVPSGKSESTGVYSDGIFVKNKDTTGVHPFTWEYLPVYTYDSEGRADRVILYRLVEGEAPGTDPAFNGYKSPQYADGQSFYLTSEVSKTWDGWLIYTDDTHDYVIKDGVYYDVGSDGYVKEESEPQPDPKKLHPADAQGEYRTYDKALPYQSVSVKNEHTVSDIYIDVTKSWNDAYLYDSERHEPKVAKNGNAYDRRNIKLTLHGTIDNGRTVVDLVPDDPSTTDLELTIDSNEDQTKESATGDKKINGHTVYRSKSSGSLYALVVGESEHEDGLYPVAEDQIDYSHGPIEGPTDLKVVKNGDGTYKIDGSHYGAMFENLQAYHDGQLIDYTVTESYKDIDSFIVTGGNLTEKKEGSTLVGYTMSDLTRIEKNEDLLGYTGNFINTPVIDDKNNPLPVTISKKDGYTGAPLKDAVFTVYTDPFNKVLPESSTYKQIDNYTVLKDAQNKEYVLKTDGYYLVTGDTIGDKADPQPSADSLTKVENTNYRKVGQEEIWTDKKGHNYVKRGNDYYEVDADGIISGSKADPQPSAALSRIKTSGEVDEIRVITGSDGKATVNFNRTGTYYIVETGSPEGYKPDTTMYKFVVDKKLNKVTLADKDDGHETRWWERLFDLIFGDGTNTEKNWSQNQDKRGGTLTVKDTPLTSNVLVRKIWDDANDQDGKRPNTANDLPKVILQYTTNPSDDSSWRTAQIYDSKASVPGLVDVDEEQVTHGGGAIHSSAENAYTWSDLPAYRDGKVVYYRVHEWGKVLSDGIYRITSNQTVSTHQTVFTMVDDSVSTVNRIVDVTNAHTPQQLTIKAKKHWNDNGNEDHKRPGTLKITLYRIVNGEESKVSDLTLNGEADTEPKGKYYEVEPSDDGNSWNAVFRELPAFENGSPVTYRLEETLTDGDKVNYVNSYSVSYKDTSGSQVDTDGKDSVASNDVYRTFEDVTETIEAGGATYDVYIEDETRYVRKGDDSGYKYYVIKTDGSVDFDTPADPQPNNPVVSKIRVETTEATLKVDNVLKNNIDTVKYWIGGATANIRFTLYRTSKEPPTEMTIKNSNAAPVATGKTITVGSATYDTYIHANGSTYVNKGTAETPEWHEVTGKGTEDDPYVIAADQSTPQIRTWTPFDSDGVTLIDGWERVDDHLFVSSAFKTSLELPGDDEDHVFEDLPQMDPSGNRYTYRVLETTTAGAVTDDRFEGHYSEDGLTVTNINKKVADGSADVDVLKDLQGRAWDARYEKTKDVADKDEFFFWIDPIKAVTSDGAIIEFNDSEAQEKAKVPIPGDGKKYGRAVSQNTAVGTTSREVSFSPILYQLSDIGQAGDSKEFYYKVYEAKDNQGTGVDEKDDKGITYDGSSDGLLWKRKTAVMKVVATADNSGVVTTQHYWMQIDEGSTEVKWVTDTPVFRNTYASEGNAKVWIEKNVVSREWEPFHKELGTQTGDAYQFTIAGISGAALNTPGTADDSYTTKPLVSNTVLNPQKDLQKLSDSEWAFGVTGNPYSGDMLGDDGEEYYIYEIYEEKTTTSNGDDLGIDNYKVDNVTYDDSKLFAKLHVEDKWDGTLKFEVRYYTDASCKDRYEITGHKVWIKDKDGEKRLLSVEEAAEAERMSPEERTAAGYRQVNAAYFTNYESVDIPVTKQWIGGPAIEDVTVHLVQHLFPLSDEAALDGTATTGLTGVAFVEDAEEKWRGTDKFWQKVGYVKDIPRGDFLNADGTPKQDIGSDGVSNTYRNIEGFNKDLPKYVEKGGVTYRAVYKLVENDTSDTYTREYDPQYYINRDSFDDPLKGLVVKNTVVATNTADIAAVKQLLGRSW